MIVIPEPLRQQIEQAARKSPDTNIPNNDDPADDDSNVEDGAADQCASAQPRTGQLLRP